jgi:hypothetical protein
MFALPSGAGNADEYSSSKAMALIDGGDGRLARVPDFKALYRRDLEANVVGATLAYL